MDYYNRMHTNEPRKSVYKRLGPRKSRYDSSGDEPEAETRVDPEDNDRVLDREELESRRPQVKPWEINPEYVPKRGYYFEHDNREGDQPSYGDRGGYNRGRGRGRGRGGRGTYNHFYKRKVDIYESLVFLWLKGLFFTGNRYDRSPEWKHDKFHEVQDDQEGMFEN